MNNIDIKNPNEGMQVATLKWPFNRYQVLIPKQLGGDIFVWLFISLMVNYNAKNKLDKTSYTDEVELKVKYTLTRYFSSVIDDEILEKIVRRVHLDFVFDAVDPKTNTRCKRFTKEALTFIDTYENLFSDNLDINYIYQDAITGEVLPYFGDTASVQEVSDDKSDLITLKETNNFDKPNKFAIKKAYNQYIKLKKFSANFDADEVELSDDYDDEEILFDEEDDYQIFETEKKSEKRSLNDYNVVYVDNSLVKLNLGVRTFVENNKIVVQSPFNKMTDPWMNKCLVKARNVSSDDCDYKIKELENLNLISAKKIDEFFEVYKNDVASSLKYCTEVYRLIESLNDNALKKDVLDLDRCFRDNSDMCYLYIGRLLDNVLTLASKDYATPIDERAIYKNNFELFCDYVDVKLGNKNLNYNFAKTQNIFEAWTKKYVKRDGSVFTHFKADFIDLFLNTNISDSSNVYPDFIDDVFYLYDKRNGIAHGKHVEVKTQDTKILVTFLKVIFELI